MKSLSKPKVIDKHWKDYEIQNPDGSWTTIADLLQENSTKERKRIGRAFWKWYKSDSNELCSEAITRITGEKK